MRFVAYPLPRSCRVRRVIQSRRRPVHVLVGAAAIIAVTVGCSSGDGGSDAAASGSEAPLTTVAAPPAGNAAAPTDDQLSGVLLTRTDLPVGFEPTPTLADYGLPEPEGPDLSTTQPAACGSVLAPVAVQVAGASGSAEASFTGGDFLTVDETIAGYASDAVPAAFDAIQATLLGCEQFSGTDADGVVVDYRVSGGPQLPDLAESAEAVLTFRLSTTSEGITMVTDVVVAAVGNSILQLSAGGIDPIGDDIFSALTATAVERAATI